MAFPVDGPIIYLATQLREKTQSPDETTVSISPAAASLQPPPSPSYLSRRSAPFGSVGRAWSKVRKAVRSSDQAGKQTCSSGIKDRRNSYAAHAGTRWDISTAHLKGRLSQSFAASESAIHQQQSSTFNGPDLKNIEHNRVSDEQRHGEAPRWLLVGGITATTVIEIVYSGPRGDEDMVAPSPMAVRTTIEGPFREERRRLVKRERRASRLAMPSLMN